MEKKKNSQIISLMHEERKKHLQLSLSFSRFLWIFLFTLTSLDNDDECEVEQKILRSRKRNMTMTWKIVDRVKEWQQTNRGMGQGKLSTWRRIFSLKVKTEKFEWSGKIVVRI